VKVDDRDGTERESDIKSNLRGEAPTLCFSREKYRDLMAAGSCGGSMFLM
jgi:hypothetical protein